MHATLILTGVLVVVMSAPVSAQQSIAPVFEKDIVYNHVDGTDLKLDFARPAGDGPYPCVLCFHGGGFQLGGREEMHPMLSLLSRHGFAAASVTYRLTPKHPFPAAFEDAKCAVRFVRAKAKELKIDPNRVGVLGASAGGTIALMVGLTRSRDGLDGSGHAGQSSGVQAVINFFGPSDFATLQPTAEGEEQIRQAYGKGFRQVLADALGTTNRSDEMYKLMSPMTYVRKGGPPVLTLHGTQDLLVTVEQAKMLHLALKTAGVSENLILVEQGGHGWSGADLDRTNRAVIDFLSKLFLPADQTAENDGTFDAKARAVADEFSRGFLAKDTDALLKLVSAPFAVAQDGKLKVLRDLEAVKELIRNGVAADVPPGTQLEIERVFTYQAFLENHADLIKTADRKLLDPITKRDDRVLVVQVKDASGKPAKRLILVVGWRDGNPRLTGIGT